MGFWNRQLSLIRTRKLPSSLVDSLHQQGLIYADNQQNAVFIRRSLNELKITGATLRGTAGEDNSFKGLAKGTKRSEGWFYFSQGGQSSDPINRAVLVESPIDALSFAVLDRNDSRRTVYISTDGAGHVPNEFLQQLRDVVIAYDNDQAGKLMAPRVLSQFPNAVRKLPKTIDWNEDLVNQFNWSQESRSKSIKRQLQPEQKRHRGLSL